LTADGKQEWSTVIVGPAMASSTTFGFDGEIYINTNDLEANFGGLQQITAIGEPTWNRSFDNPITAPPLFDPDGRLLLHSNQGELWFYLDDGTEDATADLGFMTDFFNHGVIDDGVFAVSDTATDSLVLLPLALGIPTSVPLGNNIVVGPAVNSDGNFAVIVGDSGNPNSEMFLIDAAGNEVWSMPVEGHYVGAFAIDSEDRMYVGMYTGTDLEDREYFVRCIEKDQSLRWEREVPALVLHPIIAGEGKLLLPLLDLTDSSSQQYILLVEEEI
jgi:hypothetical protein